ncbi:MAG: ABC transporter permease [Gammaproteobacteria bacterium]|nr:ABC transporter permease [Gammaproteobacteria bacterium]
MLINVLKQILIDLWTHKLRSFLALFGIMWGTISVIMLLAVGNGFQVASYRNMMRLVDGTFFLIPGSLSKSYRGNPSGRVINAKVNIMYQIVDKVHNIKEITPVFQKRSDLNVANKKRAKDVYGVSSAFARLQKIDLINSSRFINKLDVLNKSRVVVLGSKVKEQLFGDDLALGKSITINHVRFLVIGVIKEGTKKAYDWYRNRAIIPYSTYITMFGNENVPYFIVLPKASADSNVVENNIRAFFARHYNFSFNDKHALNIFSTTKFFQFMRWFFIGIKLFLGLCGALTLAVGALGVANIMFVIVTERRSEIGLKMALGARRQQILSQIMLEALLIVFLGGLFGFVISSFTILLIILIGTPDWMGVPAMSFDAAVVTIFILALLAVAAGFFPAKQAASMDPVEALRKQ